MLAFILALLLGLSSGHAGHVGSVHTFDVVGGGPVGGACGSGPC